MGIEVNEELVSFTFLVSCKFISSERGRRGRGRGEERRE